MAPREQSRRRVREVAAVAADEVDFFARLTQVGVLVKLRYSARDPGRVTGYAVGLDAHTTAAGTTVWYGGGRLAPDLMLPRLRSRWSSGTPPPTAGGHAARLAAAASFPPVVSRRAAETVRDAIAAIRDASSPAVAYAAADLLTATAHAWEGPEGGPLSDAAEWFDRAAHDLRERVPDRRVSQAGHLRAMARLIGVMGTLPRDRDTVAALHLVLTLAALAESLAVLREAQHRLRQARAARHAAGQLRGYRPPAGTPGGYGGRAGRPIVPDPRSTDRRGRHG